MSVATIRPEFVILMVALPLAGLVTCAIVRKHQAEDRDARCAELIDRTQMQVTFGGVKKRESLSETELRALRECAELRRYRTRAQRAIYQQLDVATKEIGEARREVDDDDEPRATPEGLERRARSEAKLEAEGVPINPDLPTIETSDKVTVRSQQEILDRTIALTIVALKGEGLARADVEHGIARFEAKAFFSPRERAFIEDNDPSRNDRVQFVWRYESAAVMLWALGFDQTLPRPDHEVDARHVTEITTHMGPVRFRERAKLRSVKDLLDEADLIYRYNWACVDARLKGQPLDTIDCRVVVERHHALNWLIGYQGQAWDDVSTDT